ncbi:WXG100 family type VII secretion target [Auraticoccus sp. F435]|uniref:ESAT-6-like protein n=1 Tax=Auraticoccus cholistanensis TaxID=2656650 RepID=A0A6A9UQ12_9ACTN|nr:WXG100 family type VII secretion target [Auraticoccus cholistanensis]MVA74813.1 WXG100 family type VII secretion target [Auraticoccus cholistanensis]
MSDYTSVNSAAMAEGISDLTNAHKQLSDHLDTLESQLSGSLAQWDGAARQAYTQAKAEWDAAAAHMASVIQKMQTTMGQISENYDANEKQIEGQWA